jgi:hypothetical protein
VKVSRIAVCGNPYPVMFYSHRVHPPLFHYIVVVLSQSPRTTFIVKPCVPFRKFKLWLSIYLPTTSLVSSVREIEALTSFSRECSTGPTPKTVINTLLNVYAQICPTALGA